MAIRADEIASAESLGAGVDDGDLLIILIICYVADRVIPVEANSKTGRAVEQEGMQCSTANPSSGVCGKGGLGGDEVH